MGEPEEPLQTLDHDCTCPSGSRGRWGWSRSWADCCALPARSALNKEWVGAGRTPTRPSLRRLGQTSGVDNVVVVPADSSLVVVWMPASGAVDMPLAVRPGPRPRPGGSGRA